MDTNVKQTNINCYEKQFKKTFKQKLTQYNYNTHLHNHYLQIFIYFN